LLQNTNILVVLVKAFYWKKKNIFAINKKPEQKKYRDSLLNRESIIMAKKECFRKEKGLSSCAVICLSEAFYTKSFSLFTIALWARQNVRPSDQG